MLGGGLEALAWSHLPPPLHLSGMGSQSPLFPGHWHPSQLRFPLLKPAPPQLPPGAATIHVEGGGQTCIPLLPKRHEKV